MEESLQGCAGAGAFAGGGSLQTLLVDAVWEEGAGFAFRIGGWLSRGGARCASFAPGYRL